jgi:hypothetical protein
MNQISTGLPAAAAAGRLAVTRPANPL